ncbi:MAG: hypothetical protein CMP20_09325 [Rickettsiales bacterium]|nr:hypothetical protein [Rickettsiales bacterium]
MQLDQICPEVLQYCAYNGWLNPQDVLNLACSSEALFEKLLGDEYAKDKLRALCGLQVCIAEHFTGAIRRLLNTQKQTFVVVFLWAARNDHIALMRWIARTGRFNLNKAYPRLMEWIVSMDLLRVCNSLFRFVKYDNKHVEPSLFCISGFDACPEGRVRIQGDMPLTLLTCAFVCIAHQKVLFWKKTSKTSQQSFYDSVKALISINGADFSANKNFILKQSAASGLTKIVEMVVSPQTPIDDLNKALDEAIEWDGNIELAKFLIEKGADPTNSALSVLESCALGYRSEMASFFLGDPRVDPNLAFNIDVLQNLCIDNKEDQAILHLYIQDARFDRSRHSEKVLEIIDSIVA